MNIELILQNEELLSFISCFAVLIGVIIAIIEIHYMRKSEHSQIIMNLHEKWDSDSLIESRNLIQNLSSNKLNVNKMVQLKKKDYLIALRVFNFFETLGFFVKTKSLRVKDVKVLMGEGIIYYYEHFEDYILQKRKQIDKDDYYKNFEYLKDKCKEKTMVEKLKHHINIQTMCIFGKRILKYP